MRPDLNKDIQVESFRNFYWLKEELQTFCKENGINASGSKLEIADRIEWFLRTGEIQPAIKKSKKKNQNRTSVRFKPGYRHYRKPSL